MLKKILNLLYGEKQPYQDSVDFEASKPLATIILLVAILVVLIIVRLIYMAFVVFS